MGPNAWREKEVHYLPQPDEEQIAQRIKTHRRRGTKSGHWDWADAPVVVIPGRSPSPEGSASPMLRANETPEPQSAIAGPSSLRSLSGTPLGPAILRHRAYQRQLAQEDEESSPSSMHKEEEEESEEESDAESSRSTSVRPKLATQRSNRPLEGVSPDHQALLTQPLKKKKRQQQLLSGRDDNYTPLSSDNDATDAPSDGEQPRRKKRSKKGIKRARTSEVLSGVSISSSTPRPQKKLKTNSTLPT